MQTVVQKWGNSLGIRIPSYYVKEFNLKNGASVEIIEKNGTIVIVPPKTTLDGLLSRVIEKSIQEAIETGVSMGSEEW